MSLTTIGAKPSDGSSKQRRIGSDIMARQDQHLFAAAAKGAGFLRTALMHSRKRLEHVLDKTAHSGAVATVLEAAQFKILAHREEWKDMVPSGTSATPSLVRS